MQYFFFSLLRAFLIVVLKFAVIGKINEESLKIHLIS